MVENMPAAIPIEVASKQQRELQGNHSARPDARQNRFR